MHIKALVVLTCLISFESPVFSSSLKSKSCESEDQKRTKALTATLYEQTQLPLDLIKIIDSYDKTIFADHGASVNAMLLLQDGRLVSGGTDGTVKFWSPQSVLLKTIKEHRAPVTSFVEISGKLYSGSLDGTIKIYDLSNDSIKTMGIGAEIGALLRISDTQFACGSWDQFIFVWKLVGPPIKQFYFEPKGFWDDDRYHHIFALTFLPEHNWIVSAGNRGHIKAWDLNDAAPVVRQEIRSMSYTTSYMIPVYTDVYALLTLPHDQILSAWEDSAIRMFDPASEKCLKTFEGHTGAVRSLVLISPTIFASGSDDKTVKLWDMTKKEDPKKKDQSIKTFVGHTARVTALVKIDERTLLSASEDGTIRRWTLE